MKIAIYSDLHLEFGRWDFVKPDADVCVFAGDIGLGLSGIKFIRSLALDHPDIDFIYVTGNHDYWGSNIQDLDFDILDITVNYPNLHFLNNESVVIKGQTFFGGTLWTDMYKRDPLSMTYAPKYMNDFEEIKEFSVELWLSIHEDFKKHLTPVLQEKDSVVVISHHAPCGQSIDSIYKGDPSNAFYYSDLSEFFGDKIPVWIHGHIHKAVDYTINGTRVVSNPRGYKGHERQADSYGDKIVEV